MRLKNLRMAVGGAALLSIAGCVTINIYFPAAAAEKAADRIIEEVWQSQPGEIRPKAAPEPEGAPAQPKQ